MNPFQMIINMFRNLFRGRFYALQQRVRAKISAQTVGRVQTRINKGFSSMDQKLNRAQDRAMGGGSSTPKKKK